jgi:hypothetical protein
MRSVMQDREKTSGFNVMKKNATNDGAPPPGGLDVACAGPWNGTACGPIPEHVLHSKFLDSKLFLDSKFLGSRQNRAAPNRPPLPVFKNDISVGLFLLGQYSWLIHLSGRRSEPGRQVELVPGNGILRWRPKHSGHILRIRHEGISPRERLQHKRSAQQFIMPG